MKNRFQSPRIFSNAAGAPRRSERGVALVITLVLLSVITFMAIAFLVLSKGQRSSVANTIEQQTARLAADSALERVQLDLLSQMLATANAFNYDLRVSTSYINPLGFDTGGLGFDNPTNVNYDYVIGGGPYSGNLDHWRRNIANLLIDPRPPVFVSTNRGLTNDFRFYLDLNQNGRYDTNGLQPIISADPTKPFYDTNGNLMATIIGGNTLSNYFIGDPEWIGVLEFPDRPHSKDNRFLSRYAYMAIPLSKTLDINFIHNQANTPTKGAFDPNGKDYLRNQGVGTWEINGGAFLFDLNTNTYAWGTGPNTYAPLLNVVSGNAYADAGAIVRGRCSFNPSTQASVSGLYGAAGQTAFTEDFIDGYSAGPLMLNSWPPPTDPELTSPRITTPWSGAESPNHFYKLEELFDSSKTSAFFVQRLTNAGAGISSYDRYTFYRMQAQLGTDSEPESASKMNLNYDNLVHKNPQGLVSATNFYAWKAQDFLAQAANRMFADAGYTFSIASITNIDSDNPPAGTGIQIYPTNFYTPAVHRFLQLAANLYDATTSNRNNGFPTVFRPKFSSIISNGVQLVYIAGYAELTDHASFITSAPNFHDLTNGSPNITLLPKDMVYGVPLLIGAKKGFPNFNEFAMQTEIYATRLLEFKRDPLDGDPNIHPVKFTNQMYVLGISNFFGLEAWNSYRTVYPGPLELRAAADMTSYLTVSNSTGKGFVLTHTVPRFTPSVITITANSWQGWPSDNPNNGANNFVLPFQTNSFMFLTNSTYLENGPTLKAFDHKFVDGEGFYVPLWWLTLNTKVRFSLYNPLAQRIVDYVNFSRTERTLDIMAKLREGSTCLTGSPEDYNNIGNMWCSNRLKKSSSLFTPTYGIQNQIDICLNGAGSGWKNYSWDPYSGRDMYASIDGFRKNLMDWDPLYNPGQTFNKSNVFYAPLSPYRPIYLHTSWQVNDPLVHYMVGDLLDVSLDETNWANFSTDEPVLKNIGFLNTRYQPWNYSPSSAEGNSVVDRVDPAAKDPGVKSSDYWSFPTNRLANVGWLGKVHRGSPWQTVNFKSTNLNLRKWTIWSGNPLVTNNVGQLNNAVIRTNTVYQDAIFSSPTNDPHLVDLFTTAFNENATRGRLSVNQTNLAAWSALLSGVNILSNSTLNGFIEPAGPYDPAKPPALVAILNGINRTRSTFTNQVFQRLGDILATPQLTMASPYLSGPADQLTEEVYERIPQQVLGLLKGGELPRFLILAYGQSLKPADRSLVTSGTYIGLCTNYQVTAEVATRAVVRIEGAPNQPRAIIESFNVLPPD